MDKPELLEAFKKQLEAFDKYQTFIAKAREQAEKFRPEVVEKVVADNTAKIEAVAEALNPLVPEVQGVIAELGSERRSVEEAVEAARLRLEELELRAMIGELDEEGFEAEAAPFKSEISSADEILGAFDGELEQFQSILQQWLDARPAAGETVEADLLGDLDDDESAFGDQEGRGDGVHAELVEGLADDVSAVFEEEEEAIPAPEITGGEGISFDEGELDDLGDDVLASAPAAVADGEGTAVLIVGEGTDEEHLYPVTEEVVSVGRGRDSTIQVKNDSKVSRYHCKLYKRDSHYFIEDNKSANGTLVDGELITEKRLLGGEEVIIGETFFKFRITA